MFLVSLQKKSLSSLVLMMRRVLVSQCGCTMQCTLTNSDKEIILSPSGWLNDPCSIRFDHKSIRHHLARCLEECKFTCFPTLGERNSSGIKHIQKTELHCSCLLPEEVGIDQMAECDACKVWYHQHCMDIPPEVFNNSDVPWKCKKCESL